MKPLFKRLREMIFKNTKRTREGFFDGAMHKECEKNKNTGVTYKASKPVNDE